MKHLQVLPLADLLYAGFKLVNMYAEAPLSARPPGAILCHLYQNCVFHRLDDQARESRNIATEPAFACHAPAGVRHLLVGSQVPRHGAGSATGIPPVMGLAFSSW